MPAPLIPIIAGVAARVAAGTAGRAAIGQAAKTAGQQAVKTANPLRATYGTGRTASGKTLQATKPKKLWDWSNMASNFTPNDGDSV
jgi:hypothetical protein